MKNYYLVLEVPSDASQDIIKEQYRFLVQAWHPDKFPTPAQKIKAEEKIKEINAAYEILRDPAKRAEYDSITRSSRLKQEQEYYRQEEEKANQRRAEDEQRKRDEVAHHKEAEFKKERGNREKADSSLDRVKVFIEGKECILSIEQLVHAKVRYFFEGEGMGSVYFSTRAHVEAALNHTVLSHGFEIHVIQLAGQKEPYRTWSDRKREVKNVKVFVERNGKLEERMVKETDLFGANIRYYRGKMSMGRQWLRNLKDVRAAIRKCTEYEFVIVVEKFDS